MRRLVDSILALSGLVLWGLINRGVGYYEGYATAKVEDLKTDD